MGGSAVRKAAVNLAPDYKTDPSLDENSEKHAKKKKEKSKEKKKKEKSALGEDKSNGDANIFAHKDKKSAKFDDSRVERESNDKPEQRTKERQKDREQTEKEEKAEDLEAVAGVLGEEVEVDDDEDDKEEKEEARDERRKWRTSGAADERVVSAEFQWLSKESENRKKPDYSVALNHKNRDKNRYGNALPNPETRVLLKGGDTDYINANYIEGERTTYIAAQAPLPNTFGDFWLMVYEQRTRVIMMLTRLMENDKTKAEVYWPRKGPLARARMSPTSASGGTTLDEGCFKLYGKIRVCLVKSIMEEEEITIRYFRLRHEDHPRPEHSVIQIHYTGWPDFGVPENTRTFRKLLDLMERFNKDPVVVQEQPGSEGGSVSGGSGSKSSSYGLSLSESASGSPPMVPSSSHSSSSSSLSSSSPGKVSPNGPVVLHCSAGLGRTGTLIAAHIASEKLRYGIVTHPSLLDMKQIVSNLRDQRDGMVQTKCQYKFLYDLVKELQTEANREKEKEKNGEAKGS